MKILSGLKISWKIEIELSRSVLFHMKLEFVSNILWMVVCGNNFLFLTRPRPFQISFVWEFRNSMDFDIF